MHHSAQIFANQLSGDVYISDIYYILGAVACFLVVVAISLIDGGLVNPKHLIDTLVQTLLSALIAGAALLLVRDGGIAAGKSLAGRVIAQMRRLALDQTLSAGVALIDGDPSQAIAAARDAAASAAPGQVGTRD